MLTEDELTNSEDMENGVVILEEVSDDEGGAPAA
jgi:hypothetical protein